MTSRHKVEQSLSEALVTEISCTSLRAASLHCVKYVIWCHSMNKWSFHCLCGCIFLSMPCNYPSTSTAVQVTSVEFRYQLITSHRFILTQLRIYAVISMLVQLTRFNKSDQRRTKCSYAHPYILIYRTQYIKAIHTIHIYACLQHYILGPIIWIWIYI